MPSTCAATNSLCTKLVCSSGEAGWTDDLNQIGTRWWERFTSDHNPQHLCQNRFMGNYCIVGGLKFGGWDSPLLSVSACGSANLILHCSREIVIALQSELWSRSILPTRLHPHFIRDTICASHQVVSGIFFLSSCWETGVQHGRAQKRGFKWVDKQFYIIRNKK